MLITIVNILVAKFNFTVQGTLVNDNATNLSTRYTTTQERPLPDDGLNTTKSLETALDGFQVGSFLFYILIGVGSSVIVVVAIAIVILITYLIRHTRIKISNFSLAANQLCSCRWRQRRSSNEEIPSPDITTLPNRDEDLILQDTPPLEFESPVHSPPTGSANAEEHEENRNKSLPPRKCDRIPIYIFLGPNERDPPFPKGPVECENNLAYIHLGPEDSSTAAPSQHDPVTCKHNAAYIHLDPEDTSDSESV